MNRFITFLVLAIATWTMATANGYPVEGSVIETDLSDTETDYLVFMREEEKLARDTYITMTDQWGLQVFSNIFQAEQMHMDAMLVLLSRYVLADPVVDNSVGAFTNTGLAELYAEMVASGSTSTLDAFYVGGYVEEVDIRDLQLAIAESTQPDIIATYESLLAASKNHLRAFADHVQSLGLDYVAQVLDQAEVDAILGDVDPGVFVMNAGLNDAWYDPETDGQGFFITVLPALELVSLAWFTYDTERPAEDVMANLGDAGHRWLTAVGPYSGDGAQLEIYITVGGIFDSAEPVPESGPGGTILLHFDNCNSGTINYDIPSIDRTGVVLIERVAADNVGLCEMLVEASN